MAGMRTVEELLKLAPDLYDITVFGAEPHGNYNRILLSPVLAGEKTVDDIMLNTRAWYGQHGIELLAGDPVGAIDRPRRLVRSASGKEVRYDRLLLATGSKPFIIPVPGHTLDGVIAFRDIQDVETMLHAARNHRHAVVIGGGLLGLEAANGLMRQGMDVTVVHLADSLMERQLDKPAAELLKVALERKGLRFLLSAQTAGMLGATASPACCSRTARRSRRPGGDDRRACAPISNWPPAPACAASARSSSTTRCRPSTRASTPWANACSTARPRSAWWRRSGTRHGCAPPTWPVPAIAAMCSRPPLPSSR
jgi:hypothetical protein